MGVSLLALVLAIGVMPSGGSPATAVSPHIVISQVYGGGGNSGAVYKQDFIELFNRGTTSVSVEGWSLQYASATGTGGFGSSSTQLTELPALTLPPGGYLLIQEAAGTGAQPSIPAPDHTDPTPIAMAATAGKVALVMGTEPLGCNGGSTPCSAEQVARIVDLVGFGGANYYEGASAAPVMSNSTSDSRNAGGCQDTDNNGADFTNGAPAPRNSGTSPAPCGTTPTPTPTPTPNECGDPATLISQVQGTGTATTYGSQTVTVEAVVVGDYQATTQFRGYHLQEEDADADGDALSSEGLFVFSTTPVAAGDLVRVTGRVSEFSNSTQITPDTAKICSSGNTVTATDVDFPVASVSDLERYESMLVSIDQPLTVTEVFNLGRFGEVMLSANGRQMTPTAVVEPGAAAQALQALNDRSRIVLDDAINTQNIDPTVYPQGGLSASNTLRVGDGLDSITAVLEQRFGGYRLQPVGTIAFDHDNTRPATPATVGGRLRVSAMNVLNYFTTFDNAGPICGPNGDMDCRGAESDFEFERQKAKIISALVGLDADVVGLMEIQNDLLSDTTGGALADLVAGLNTELGADTYDYIATGTIGTDAIKVALIYKTDAVTPVRDHAILDSSVDPRFDDTRSRPALAQTFKTRGGRFTVVVNHLKSKGSACAGDPDTGDGSGNCNVTRTNAAEALVDWLATDPTDSNDLDVLVIGDLNSYAKEDPIDVFVGAGYTDLAAAFADDAYSYVFQGQSGYLDYALASPSLLPQITGATEWHINADEPSVLDYNTNFKQPGHISTLYAADAYRSSDHDPVLVGLRLNGPDDVNDQD